jgi:hypothetical protein
MSLISHFQRRLTSSNPWIRIKNNSVALVREQTIPTERPPLVGKVNANFADRACRVVSATDPHGRILAFLDLSRYFFFQVAPQLYSRGWVDAVPDPVLLRKSGSTGNITRASGSVSRNYTTKLGTQLNGYIHLWADCLYNVGSLTSHNPIGLHGLLRE